MSAGGASERICAAMLDLVSAQGYAATSEVEVRRRAGVSAEELRRHFSSKEDCALAVFERFMADYESEVRAAYESEASWPDSLRAAAYAVARWISEHPREARFGGVEMLWAGELAQARREAAFQSFVELIDAGRQRAEDPDSIPASAAEGVIGAIAAMLTRRLQHGAPDPYEMVPELMYMAVLPYLGEEAAARELKMAPPRPAPDCE